MSERIASYYERLAEYLRPLIEWPLLPWTILAAAALLLLLVGIRRYRRAHRPIVPFQAEGGDVEIAPSTIRGLINGTVKSVPGVKAATSRYEQKGRRLRLRIAIHIQGSAKLIEVQHEIKRRVRMALHAHIGMDPKDIDPVNIKVTRIIGDPDVRNTATIALPHASTPPRRDRPAESSDEDILAEESHRDAPGQDVDERRGQERAGP